MSNQLQIVKKANWEFAYYTDADGVRWYNLTCIAKILHISDTRRLAERIPEKHKRLVNIKKNLSERLDSEQDKYSEFGIGESGQVGNPNKWFVDESGLYQAIVNSNSPEAEIFTEWVTSEVLPQIRQYGYYIDKTAISQSPEKAQALYDDAQALRAEEKNFTAKVKHFFTYCIDYDPKNEDTQKFFANLQNLFLYAITGHTAAEIIVERIDANKEKCGLTQDISVTRTNLKVSKNYLVPLELKQLKILCNLYLNCLESLESRSKRVTMDFLKTFFEKLLQDMLYKISDRQSHISAYRRDQIIDQELTRYKRKQKQLEAILS